MTIIAYRDGILAADSLVCSYGSRSSGTLKIERVNEWMIGGAGILGAIFPVKKWILAGANLEDPVDFGKVEDSGVLLVSPDGTTYHVGTSGNYVTKEVASFAALGSGSEAARAAMLLGCTAVEAVHVACEIETSCGGKIVWMNLDGSEDLELPKEIYNAPERSLLSVVESGEHNLVKFLKPRR